ncbi:Dopey-N domain-containing protein [Mycena indigotica]|uniref:Dopey-N domain-containing protein n=1 Tax=Mycena indigotica TaxID=2126181 RepID=A0A8H6W689_9AGAR|nr:Dopey-N domain-containing protein [Mycena indigotica]KAF7307364.1 Dopey-N domain-containing protein [Mycena indigotica]
MLKPSSDGSVKKWVSDRNNERVAAQQAFATDPKYKKYTQQVERCLNSFDNVHEWADCIAFLKQLLKTFQSYMQFKEIPRKLIVAKRLSQCLNPALPTGVHQRALDVYSHILAVLGSEGLKRDLAVWSSGLFPFFEYAATSVKPALLNLYEIHYLPLQTSLRPIMKSFIIALLPGLEEETGEFFEKVLGLLDRLSGTVSPSFFFQNMWLVMLTTPSARGNALNLLSRRLPRLNAEEDITLIIGRDIGLMIRSFAAALEDDNLLVRRGALDLLLQSMRVDSVAIRQAQAEDRAILMRAATSVVLRRDLSLNRRLYTWLLGPDENSEHQIAYLREHALVLLRSTLKEEMTSPSGEYAESRPFKIFISLLDKWEIGASLTESLVFDAFRAIKYLIETADGAEEVTMTASTLYEAVEPPVLWKQLLGAVFNEISGTGTETEAIEMILFVLKTFVQDEEVRTIHLPIIFASLVDLVDIEIQLNREKALTPAVRSTLILLEAILQQIPHAALLQRPELTGDMEKAAQSQRPYTFATNFYGCKTSREDTELPEGPFTTPFASSFQSLATTSTTCSQFLVDGCSTPASLREVLAQSLLLMDRLSTRLEAPMTISWKPQEWLPSVLAIFEHESCNFTVVDRAISLIVALHATPTLLPKLLVDDRPTMYKMVTRLLEYLRPNLTVYHARSVNLIWSLERATSRSHVESILAQTMTSPESRNVQDAYEAFGVLWRLTEDTLLPGFRFRVPMMIVLDTLKNDDPALRRIGETWMRCSLKSYLRVLDPILFDLLDPGIRRLPTTTKVKGKELQGFFYERPFDQRYVNHLLDMLLGITRFGGQGFAKTTRSTPIKRSHHSGLIQRVESGGFPDAEPTYLDVLVEILMRFLQSEPKPASESVMHPNNLAIQSTSIDLLQSIAARGEMDPVTVETIEAAIIGKLYFSIHRTRLDLQNKLLHLLHSLISASVAHETNKQRQADAPVDATSNPDTSQDISSRSLPINPLLIQTLVDGISTPTNRPVLQHWLDFVLMAVPQFQPALQAAVTPLNECMCKQLLASLGDVLRVTFEDGLFKDDLKSSATDAELVMLLGGLERMVLLSLAYPAEPSSSDDDPTVPEKSAEGGGLLGYVSTVFSSESTQNSPDDQLTAKSAGYRSLHEGVRVLYLVWSTLAWEERRVWESKDESLAMIYNRTRMRCRRVLEHLFRMQSAEVFESIIDCWNRELPESQVPYEQAFELVDVLIASAQSAVHMICESITCRVSGISERSKKQAINPDLTESVLFKFLEQYLQRLEGPLALQVWGRYLQLVKDVSGGTREFKPQTYPALRCLTILAEKVTQTTAMEDRKIRKELQETFGKLLDSCVVFVGRAYDQGSWIRRSTKDALVTNGRESPAPRDEKLSSSVTSLSDPRPASFELASQINQFIATTAMSGLRKFLMDNDKVVAACTNIVYYIVSPAMKGKSSSSASKPLDVDPAVMGMIEEMTKIPSTLKTWRAPVVELLNDNKLFNCTSESADKWKLIFKALFDQDKAAFPELLAKVATAPSANIFTNREYEMLVRSLNVRRLSYILFTGEKNFFLTLLPSIQEKLVDILRNVTAPIVQSEVYLCIRVLLCRLSAHNLTSFWPVLLTELYRIFEQLMTALPPDGAEDLQLILSASKCLDLLLTLQSEEFQIHQWIFITDTVDAIYRPDECFPEAMLDQIAELVADLPVAESRDPPATNGLLTVSPAANTLTFPNGSQVARPLRRPMLNTIRQIESIRDLGPFFASVSMAAYESVYASAGNVDWAAVERGLVEDMFDGR